MDASHTTTPVSQCSVQINEIDCSLEKLDLCSSVDEVVRPIAGSSVISPCVTSSKATPASTASVTRKSANDFVFLKPIGEGSFSTVYKCQEVSTDRFFAIKVCDKKLIIKEKKTAHVMREKDVMAKLTRLSHPFFVSLYCTFHDNERLYFVMTLAENGELLDLLRKLGSFDQDVSRFYTAEIVCALDHLHKLGIVHRDLKPENILLGQDMHILISDFGSAKILHDETRPTPLLPQSSSNRRGSFVGTAQYVSPEVLNGEPVSFSSDFWALGCILYQMLAGLPPFREATEYLVFQKVLKADYAFPDDFPEVPLSLIKELLKIDHNERLGDENRGGIETLKKHQFFNGVNWRHLPNETPPAVIPYLPASRGSQSVHSNYKAEPGFGKDQITRLLGLEWNLDKTKNTCRLFDYETGQEREYRLSVQRRDNPYHKFVENNVILKSGVLYKRRGLFSRKRMFLLTDGPHLYYVDPSAMSLKGEVPWSRELRPEGINFRIFFIHTPKRIYYLEDPSSHSSEWVDAIDELRRHYYEPIQHK